MIQKLFYFISLIFFLYLLICFIYILLSWLPAVKFTKFGKTLSKICEPYLKLFSKNSKMIIANIDFSCLIALTILSLGATIFSRISNTGFLCLSEILILIIYSIWDIFKTITIFLGLLSLVRWIVLVINHGVTNPNSGWNNLDVLLNSFCYKVPRFFTKKQLSFQNALLFTWISCIAFIIVSYIILCLLTYLCHLIPF